MSDANKTTDAASTPAAAKPAPKPAATKPATAPAKSSAAKPAAKPAAPAPATTDPASLLNVASAAVPANPKHQELIQWMDKPRPAVELVGNVPNTFDGRIIELRLYAESCPECPSLTPVYEEEGYVPPDCHFSKGNLYCPAAHLRIRFVGEKLRALARLKKAQESGDVNRLTKAIAGLESLDIESRREVLQETGIFSQS